MHSEAQKNGGTCDLYESKISELGEKAGRLDALRARRMRLAQELLASLQEEDELQLLTVECQRLHNGALAAMNELMAMRLQEAQEVAAYVSEESERLQNALSITDEEVDRLLAEYKMQRKHLVNLRKMIASKRAKVHYLELEVEVALNEELEKSKEMLAGAKEEREKHERMYKSTGDQVKKIKQQLKRAANFGYTEAKVADEYIAGLPAMNAEDFEVLGELAKVMCSNRMVCASIFTLSLGRGMGARS